MGINIGKISNKVAGVQAIGDKLGLFKKKDRERRDLEQDPRVVIARNGESDTIHELFFPSDIGKKFFMMQFKKYDYSKAIGGTGEPLEKTSQYISLPIPKELIEKYNVNYQNEQLGLTGAGLDFITGDEGAAAREQFKQGNYGAAVGEIGDAIIAAPKALSAVAGVKAIKSRGGAAVGAGLAALGVNSVQNAVELGFGLAQNPVERALFKGVPLRDFNFTWKLVPRNADEVDNIKKIIKVIRKHMLPSKSLENLGSPIFNYPDVVDFEFKGTMLDVPYNTSFVTSLNVDYAPDGASFFIRDGYPTAYAISIGFKEFKPLDASQFNDDNDAANTE